MKNFALIAVSATAIALAACSDNETVEDDATIADTDTNADMMADDAMPMGGDLSEDQQANYDAMDRQAVSDEYDANRDAMMSGDSTGGGMSGSDSMSGDNMSDRDMSENDMSGDDGMEGNDSAMSTSMPARSQMDFAYLDRNSDGQLSVAEYAIWAVPANPNTPVANDQTKPYISTDQINQAGQTFFYFDEDGDSYLSQGEFTTARNSARTPGSSNM